MRYSIAVMGLAFVLFGLNPMDNAYATTPTIANPGPPPVLPVATAAKDSDEGDDLHSKNPVKKIRGKWSWLNHEKSGCTETVYVLSAKKEDIYARPAETEDADSSGEKSKHKAVKSTHKSIGVEYHEKDGIVFLINAAGGKHWLSAYRFVDDDTLLQQTIYLDDGHQYTPFAGDLPKWNEVSVQDGDDQLARCGQESESVVGGVGENADEAKSVPADESTPPDNGSPNYTVPATPDPTGLGGSSPPAR